jgi:hypothetical protein
MSEQAKEFIEMMDSSELRATMARRIAISYELGDMKCTPDRANQLIWELRALNEYEENLRSKDD